MRCVTENLIVEFVCQKGESLSFVALKEPLFGYQWGIQKLKLFSGFEFALSLSLFPILFETLVESFHHSYIQPKLGCHVNRVWDI
jgi:hypothetical protein